MHGHLRAAGRLGAVPDDDVLDPELERDVALGRVDLGALESHRQRHPSGRRLVWLAAAIGALAALLASPAGATTRYALPGADSKPIGITAGPDGALWFTEANASKIGRITPGGAITEYPLQPFSWPYGITTGPDGALWFTEQGGRIGRLTTDGQLTEYAVPNPASGPLGITVGPDGALWFTEVYGSTIGRITLGGQIREFHLDGWQPNGIAAGSDGALWFIEESSSRIGRMTTEGHLDVYVVPKPKAFSEAHGIVAGPDGAVWFAESAGGAVGRISTAGLITEYPVSSMAPFAITAGPDGALWFSEYGVDVVGRVTTGGDLAEYGLPEGSNTLSGLAPGPDGALWFTEFLGNRVGRFDPLVDVPPCAATVRHATLDFVPDATRAPVHWEADVGGGCLTTAPAGVLDTLSLDTPFVTAALRWRHVGRLMTTSLTAARGGARIQVRDAIAPFSWAPDGTVASVSPLRATYVEGGRVVFGSLAVRFATAR